MSIKEDLSKYWDKLTPDKRRYLIVGLIVVLLLVVSVIGYMKRSRNTAAQPAAKAASRVEMNLEPGLLEKSQFRDQEQKLHERDEKIAKLQQEFDEFKKAGEKKGSRWYEPAPTKYPDIPLPPAPSSRASDTQPAVPAWPQEFSAAGDRRETEAATPPYIVPPAPFSGSKSAARQHGAEAGALTGDIEIVSNPNPKQALAAEIVKKKAEKIYLPPSYMEASLLSGLDAPTVESAKGNPVPVLIRIKNLAQLPNRVKADLKGCFAIADGIGNLADERAHLRLISITCLSKGGAAVIDQKVKGFVVDQDGKIGLAGKVVAKMGAMLARGLLSGFFGGLGDGLKQASTISLVSPVGTTQTVSSSDLVKSAAGAGIAEASHDLQKFYLKLAEATLPVIEIGAARDITLVVSEGVDLEIKNFCSRSNTLEGKCADQ